VEKGRAFQNSKPGGCRKRGAKLCKGLRILTLTQPVMVQDRRGERSRHWGTRTVYTCGKDRTSVHSKWVGKVRPGKKHGKDQSKTPVGWSLVNGKIELHDYKAAKEVHGHRQGV